MTRQATILITSLGVMNVGVACFFAGYVISDYLKDQTTIEESQQENEERNASDRNPRERMALVRQGSEAIAPALLRQTRAVAAYGAMCNFERGRCKQKLVDIQSWCNPYCQDELSECRGQLSVLKSSPMEDFFTYTSHLHR